jgi:type I restriction enzyme S subunit
VGAGDIVLAVTDLTQGREILARATRIPRLGEAFGVISLDVVRVVPHDPADRLALLLVLGSSDYPDRVKKFANGSTVLHLSPDHVAEGLIVWPAPHLRRRLVDVVDPILAAVDDLNDSADRLALMRGLLLPRLVTGQVDVSHLDLDTVGALVA